MISIIIPTLNEEKVLGQTIATIRAGMGKLEYEVIVSDGGSNDRTVDIARKNADKVEVYKGKTPQTIAHGRNAGAKRASGEYLVFLDADVTIPNPYSFFIRAISIFKQKNGLGGLTGGIRVTPENESFGDKAVFSLLNIFHFAANNWVHIGRAAGEFQMVRKSAFEAVGGFREDLVASEDYDFFSRLAKQSSTYYATGLVVFHSGRRAHQIGWTKLLYQWTKNAIMVLLFKKKASSKKWEAVR